MSLPVRFAPYSVDINTAGGTTAWINQIQSTSVEQNITLFEESGGSQTDREFVAVKEVAPTIPIDTTDLSMLATIGMAGVSITPASGSPGVVIYAREIANQSLPALTSSAVHISMAVSDGLLVPMSLNATNNSTAKLQLMLHAILGSTATYSGATPVVSTASSTIASGAAGTVNVYTSGVVKYTISGGASRLVKGVISQSVNFGLKVRKEATDGEAHVTFVIIERRYPELTFVTDDVELATEIGEQVSISSFAMFFTALSQNGQRVAAATTSHVSITGTEGIVTPTKVEAQFQKSGNAAFKFTPALNTNLLTISTSAAIPTA
jgi:hypothetical protein